MTANVHKGYMERCFELGARAGVLAAPNPMVGAILVHEDQIIGEGFHEQFGGPHAEVNCISEALKNYPKQVPRSTLYVSLEPCSHFGRTPPCADFVIANKIPKVVIACRDRFAAVNGKGIEKLKHAGVEVVEGVLEEKALALNRRFFTFQEQRRPYVILKWAQSADGFMATDSNERLFISNTFTNRLVHQWRSSEMAIMVGFNTVMKDDPLLDNRHWFGKPPLKIILDPHLKIPLQRRLFDSGAPVVLLNTIREGTAGNTRYLKIDGDNLLQEALSRLYTTGVQSILVEGGRKTLQSFIDEGLWDEARVITNQGLFVKEGLNAPQLDHFSALETRALFSDTIQYFKNNNNHFL